MNDQSCFNNEDICTRCLVCCTMMQHSSEKGAIDILEGKPDWGVRSCTPSFKHRTLHTCTPGWIKRLVYLEPLTGVGLKWLQLKAKMADSA